VALRDLFKNLFAGSQSEDRIAQYVIREHQRGRDLAEILEDNYVQNRLGKDQIARLLDRPELVRALGESTVASARSDL
jgi:hypothetical protein